jgi:hypothetical protein
VELFRASHCVAFGFEYPGQAGCGFVEDTNKLGCWSLKETKKCGAKDVFAWQIGQFSNLGCGKGGIVENA